MKWMLVALAVCILALALIIVQAHRSIAPPEPFPGAAAPPSCHIRGPLPDPGCTPGAVIPGVTAEQVCVPGYSKSVRNVPQSEKDAVYREYGIASHAPGSYEVDHLASLELSGSNDISNLWAQPYQGAWNAHMKDQVENKLHAELCAGRITLAEAVQQITTDWTAVYRRYFGEPQ